MNMLAHIADRILCRPLLIHPTKAEIILSVLGSRIGVAIDDDDPDWETVFNAPRADKPAANRINGEPAGPMDANGRRRTMYMADGGVALIPIVGTLVNRGAYLGSSSGFVSYEGLDAQIRAAISDQSIHSILLDIDSPGGEAAGMFSLAATLREARQRKPIIAVVNDMAASGAFGLASAASEIVASSSSMLGSIGVVLLHVDQSKQFEKRGQKHTLIFAGAHKVDGNPYEPLSASVREDLQREVDNIYDRFVATVAAGRKNMTEQSIRATEARTYIGEEAIAVNIADRIGGFTETLQSLKQRRGYIMDVGSNSPMRTEQGARVYSQAELDAAVTAARTEETNAAQAAINAARAEAAQAAQGALDRVRGIITHENAKGREPQALAMALDTTLSVEEAGKLLAALPIAKATPSLAERAAAPLAHESTQSNDVAIAASWDRAVEKANRAAGFVSRH